MIQNNKDKRFLRYIQDLGIQVYQMTQDQRTAGISSEFAESNIHQQRTVVEHMEAMNPIEEPDRPSTQ